MKEDLTAGGMQTHRKHNSNTSGKINMMIVATPGARKKKKNVDGTAVSVCCKFCSMYNCFGLRILVLVAGRLRIQPSPGTDPVPEHRRW